MSGWVVRASGDTDDPGAIKGLLEELRIVLSRAEHGTGSSEFNSAHAAEANFHLSPPEGEPSEPGSPHGSGKPGKKAAAAGGPSAKS